MLCIAYGAWHMLPICPAARPFDFESEPSTPPPDMDAWTEHWKEVDLMKGQGSERVEHEEQSATGKDVDDKVEDEPDEQEDALPDILEREDLYASDDSEDDTEDELEQQFNLGAHMDQATTLLSDEHIPEEGVGRKYANAVQRQLIEFWSTMHQAFLATGNEAYKLPTRCWKNL